MTEQPHPTDPAPDAPARRPDSVRADLLWRPHDQLESLLEQAATEPERDDR